MSLKDSLTVFGLKSSYTEKELKATYRKLSSKNHPDKGGSVEVMQDINVAYEILKNNTSVVQDKEDHKEFSKKWNESAKSIRDDLVKNVDISAYNNYFSDTFNEPFSSKVERIYPSNSEVDKMDKTRWNETASSVYYDITFSNKNRSKVFNLDISVYMADVIRTSNKGLTTSKTTYPMFVSTFAYIDSRKVKISSRDYTHTNKKSVFTKPATIFPKAKINNKKKKTIFKKASMIASLKAELQAEQSGDYYMVKLGDNNKYLGIYRTTMMREGVWNIGGIFEQNEKKTRYVDTKEHTKFLSFMETEEFLNILKNVSSYSSKDVIKYLNVEYKRILADAKAKG